MDRIIPVVVIKDVADTEKTLSALRNGGINTAEITFRTACAAEAIELGTSLFPDMNIGAGTVINGRQCVEALNAGAKFIVSPGLSVEVAVICAANGVNYFPGCVTALSGPFPQVKFIPTGGVDLTNLKEFLQFDKIYAVGGSFMMKGDIAENCKQINEILKEVE